MMLSQYFRLKGSYLINGNKIYRKGKLKGWYNDIVEAHSEVEVGLSTPIIINTSYFYFSNRGALAGDEKIEGEEIPYIDKTGGYKRGRVREYKDGYYASSKYIDSITLELELTDEVDVSPKEGERLNVEILPKRFEYKIGDLIDLDDINYINLEDGTFTHTPIIIDKDHIWSYKKIKIKENIGNGEEALFFYLADEFTREVISLTTCYYVSKNVETSTGMYPVYSCYVCKFKITDIVLKKFPLYLQRNGSTGSGLLKYIKSDGGFKSYYNHETEGGASLRLIIPKNCQPVIDSYCHLYRGIKVGDITRLTGLARAEGYGYQHPENVSGVSINDI